MEYVKLNELCEINIGKTPSRSNQAYWGNGNKWLSISDMQGKYVSNTKEQITDLAVNECKMKIVPKNTVLMSFKLSIGKIAITTEELYTNEAIASFPIIQKNKLISEYLYYALQTLKLDKLSDRAVKGATLNKDKLNQIKIPLTTLEQQKKIVKVLNKAQELIDKRKAQIEALDQLTQSVFLEMFGDPATNPKKWPMGFIKDLALKTQYGTSKKASEDTGKYPILRMNNITYEGHWDLTDLKYVDLDDKEVEKYLVHKGELLFNRTNSKELVGKTAVYRFEKPMAFAGYLVKLIPNEKANAEFISAYLNSKYGKSILFSMAKNIVGMANINAEELKSIKIYIPPKQLQDQFAEIVQKIESQRELFKKGLVELEKNFNSLMQRAFKGELFND